jgi:hypothetical protein
MTESTIITRIRDGESENFSGYTGTTVAAVRLISKDLDLGSSDQEKYIDNIWLDITHPKGDAKPSGLFISWAIKDRLEDEEDWSDLVLIYDEDSPVFQIRQTSRYIRIQIQDFFPTTNWQLARIIFFGELVGGRI